MRDLPPFSWLFGRRSEDRGAEGRNAEDRRPTASGSAESGDYVKATELTTEPIRLQELAQKSGIPMERLRNAAFGKEKLSPEERAVLTGRGGDEEG